MVLFLRIAALACLLGGCQASSTTSTSPSPSSQSSPAVKEHLVYERGPCFGFCPVYRFEVQRDGHYVFIGERHTQQTGRHEGVLMAEEAEKLFSLYQSIQRLSLPQRIDSAHCELYATDHSYLNLSFHSDSAPWSLHHDLGCHQFPQRDALLQLEQEIQRVLPINRWVSPADQ